MSGAAGAAGYTIFGRVVVGLIKLILIQNFFIKKHLSSLKLTNESDQIRLLEQKANFQYF